MQIDIDKIVMALAIEQARRALEYGDVPVGAVVTVGGEVVATSYNRREADNDPTAHAEVLALREAGRVLGSWRLSEATVYITKEPCVMCAGALMSARVARVVYGAQDPKYGAAWSVFNILQDDRLNHRTEVTAGVLVDECMALLKGFFEGRRINSVDKS
jgi:tRNA(adenine34) deaminase